MGDSSSARNERAPGACRPVYNMSATSSTKLPRLNSETKVAPPSLTRLFLVLLVVFGVDFRLLILQKSSL